VPWCRCLLISSMRARPTSASESSELQPFCGAAHGLQHVADRSPGRPPGRVPGWRARAAKMRWATRSSKSSPPRCVSPAVDKHAEHPVVDAQDRDVEGAAAKVVHKDRAILGAVDAVGQRRGRRLVDECAGIRGPRAPRRLWWPVAAHRQTRLERSRRRGVDGSGRAPSRRCAFTSFSTSAEISSGDSCRLADLHPREAHVRRRLDSGRVVAVVSAATSRSGCGRSGASPRRPCASGIRARSAFASRPTSVLPIGMERRRPKGRVARHRDRAARV
jgi:hypothetical protein